VSTRQATWSRPSSASHVPNCTCSGTSSPSSAARMTRSYSSATSAGRPAMGRVMVTASGTADTSDGVAPLDDADEHHHDREDQEEVDEPTERRTAHHAQEPEDQQDHEDRPQHRGTPLFLSDTRLTASDVPRPISCCCIPNVSGRSVRL